MSDNRPSNDANGGGAGGSRVPARNMADIARLFLDGARPPPRESAPKRTPPASDSPPVPAGDGPRSFETVRTTVMLALAADPQDAEARRNLLHAAHGLADEQGTTVALVGILKTGAKRTFVIDVVGVESADELPAARMPADAGGATDMQIARALHRLRPAVGIWLIAGPDSDARPFPAIASIVHDWLLACPTDDRGLVAGYQCLKKAWMKGALHARAIKPAVYLLSDDYAHAAMVHKRLRKAAQEFLKTDLALAGAGPVRGNSSEEPIRVLALSCDEMGRATNGAAHAAEEALWAAVLDELCPVNEHEEAGAEREIETAMESVEDHAAQLALQSMAATAAVMDHLAQVLDPEERAALIAAFEDPEDAALEDARKEEDSARDSVARELMEDAMPPARHVPAVIKAKRAEMSLPAAESEAAPEIAVQKTRNKNERPARIERPTMAEARQPASAAPRVEPASPVMEREPAAQSMRPAGHSLRAFDLGTSTDRQSQWQAVERSIWDLAPRSALLDARPPMSWAAETCISIDAAGRLNVWTLYKDGASWFALREWANEHRNLLALTRRDLTVNKNMEVAVHIVLPLEEGPLAHADETAQEQTVAGMLMRSNAKNVHLYRLRQVQWHDRKGLVVVPIA